MRESKQQQGAIKSLSVFLRLSINFPSDSDKVQIQAGVIGVRESKRVPVGGMHFIPHCVKI